MGLSGNLWGSLKEVKPLVVYDVEHGMALKPMQGNLASPQIYLRYTVLFRVLVVISVSF